MAEDAPELAAMLPWQLFDLAGVMLLGLGRDGRVLYINRTGADLLGRSPEEIIGSDWIGTFVPERLREKVRSVFDAVMGGRAEVAASFENPVLCPDGSERTIAWRNTVLRDPATGEVIAGLSSGEDVTGLHEAQRQLAESEARFRATFEQAAVGLAHLSLDGRFLRCNAAFRTIVGLPLDALQDMTFADVTYPDDVAAGRMLVKELVSGQRESFRLEKRYVRPDGTVVWGDVMASVVRHPDGCAAHLLAIVEDITARKSVEELSAREELQRLAFSAANAGAYEWDAATDRATWSPEVHDLFDFGGRTPGYAEWLEKCVDPRDHPQFEAATERAAAGDEAFALDFRSPGPVGMRWMSVTGRLVVDEAGRPVRAHGIVADVTRRVRAEEALRESEERLRLALGAGRIGVWDYDVLADRVTWSRSAVPAAVAAATAAPRTLEEFFALVDPRDREGARAAIAAALAGDAPYHTEVRLVGEGSPVWIDTRATVVRDPEGRPVRMIGVDRDVTAEKAHEAHLTSLAAEYDHRTRNVFQVVQALAVQSLSPGPERRRLLDRLGALFKAHAAVANGGRDLEETIRVALGPYPEERIALSGPPIPLGGRAAATLALVFHELATNAAKYGALGEVGGRLDVDWRIEGAGGGDTRLALDWREAVDRPIVPPARCGFGTQLVTESVANALEGTAAIDYPPSGLRATFTVPLAALARS